MESYRGKIRKNPMDRQPLSVSALNERVKSLLDSDTMLQDVLLVGETSNYKIYPSGHHYFTMKDADSSIRCVMFRGSAGKLRFTPESGMQVVATGRVSVFPRDGAYQLYVTSLTPHGAGDLHVAFEQLKAKLDAAGLFDPARKKPLPRYPKTIGLITSGAGAAVRDMIRILGARYPLAKVKILPVRVQGVQAPLEIAGAIGFANRHQVADLLIVGRGGGSIEDLWAFNDERVAYAIAESVIPIISAVGHEPDVTIADFVADIRAATPSNGAELATLHVDELREVNDRTLARMTRAMERRLSHYRDRLFALSSRTVLQDGRALVEARRVTLSHGTERLHTVMGGALARHRAILSEKAARLDGLSPLGVLGRGYAMATAEKGVAITRTAQVKVGEKINIRLQKGSLMCEVLEKKSR